MMGARRLISGTMMILALAAGSFFISRAQEIPVRSTSRSTHAYQAGEYIKFMIHYDWGLISTDVGWGTARLNEETVDGEQLLCSEVYGQTGRLWDRLFKVRENFRSWFTADSLQPRRFTRDTREDKYEARNEYRFVWNAEEPYIDADVYSSHSGQRYLHIPLDRSTYDLPSLFYFARNMDFDRVTPGVKHPMTFAIDDDVYHVYFILIGREKKKVKGLGTVSTIKFAAKLVAGEVFNGEQDMYIWVSDDDNRVPVYFEAPIWVGTVNGRMIEYKGNKYPFNAVR